MIAPEQREPGAETRSGWAGVAAVLVLLTGAAHLALGVAAIGGADSFQANVLEIESNEDFGKLYFSLATWGVIVAFLGIAELVAATSIWRRTPNARLVTLIVAYLALAGAFFTLAIFRWASLATIVLLLLAVFLLSYHSGRAAR